VSLAELTERFGISHGYTKKIREQQLRSGQIERVLQRHWLRSQVTAAVERSYAAFGCGRKVDFRSRELLSFLNHLFQELHLLAARAQFPFQQRVKVSLQNLLMLGSFGVHS